MRRPLGDQAIAVIGLGRFGESIAHTLAADGREVIVIDTDPARVAEMADDVTLAVEGDATSRQVLTDLGVAECGVAVVAIGEHLESSILATSLLSEMGLPEIWARALSPAHGRILEWVGAHHVVYPEQEMGRSVGKLILGD